MKYVKAKTVFPQSLLDEIQKYVQGELVYIPKSKDNYAEWGTNTNTKSMLACRNQNIVQAFQTGDSIPSLAACYHLSEDTVKKIVYGKG